jgi:hypothetical protein
MAARSGRAVLCSKCTAAALGLAAAVLVAGFVPDRQASDPIAVVGADVDESRDPAVQSEVSIAIDPGDSRIILAGSNNWGRLTRAYSSRDGGSSWTASADPPLTCKTPVLRAGRLRRPRL